jgi:hypothetical protein
MKNLSSQDARMEAYCEKLRRLENKFFGLELNHIARRYNKVADELAKIASGQTTVPSNVFARDIFKPSVVPKEASELTPPPQSNVPGRPGRGDADRWRHGPSHSSLRLEDIIPRVSPPRRAPYREDQGRRLTRRAKTFVQIEEKELY